MSHRVPEKMGLFVRVNKFVDSLFSRRRNRKRSEESGKEGYISFHASRGKDVRRSKDGTTVYKKKRFWKKPANALSFSNRTVAVGETVTIEVTNVAVIVGFMFQNPESLPRMQSSFEVFHRAEGFGIMLPKTDSCSIDFNYDKYGDVHFKMGGKDVAVFFGVVDPQVAPWVLIDMYNNVKDIRAVDGDVMPVQLGDSGHRKTRSCDLCYSRVANVILGKCGHDTCCYSCANRWLARRPSERTCPYCRRRVTSIIRNPITATETRH